MEREVKNYKQKFKHILNQLKDYCVSYYKERLISLVIFGSVAKNTFSPESDIDVLIILESKWSNYRAYSEYFVNIEEKLDKKGLYLEINPIFKSKDEINVELPYLWDTEFIILFDRDNFFNNFILDLEKFKKKRLKFRDYYIEIEERY